MHRKRLALEQLTKKLSAEQSRRSKALPNDRDLVNLLRPPGHESRVSQRPIQQCSALGRASDITTGPIGRG